MHRSSFVCGIVAAVMLSWFAAYASAADYHNRAIHLGQPAVGAQHVCNSPEAFDAFINAEKERLGDVIRRAKLPMQ